jgi:ankyrin repeat protein
LEKLLEAGADPELNDSGNWNALHYAAKTGDQNIVRRLVSFIDAGLATTDGNTPLHVST